jgi:ABC-type glycerol-3-phosphate transport system permease component
MSEGGAVREGGGVPRSATPASIGRWASQLNGLRVARKLLLYAILVGFSVLSVVPIWWMFITGLESSQDFYQVPPTLWPASWEFDRLPQAWAPGPGLNFTTFLENSAIITGVVVFGSVFSASLVAYGFARLRFPGRDALFALMLSTMMLPSAVTLIPVFLLFRGLGWIDTFLPLTVPAFFANAFNVFLLRQFYRSIPPELEEATRIDGGGALTIWWHIMLPLSAPALATVAIFGFIGTWNDFLYPLIFLSTPAKFTIQLALHLFQGEYGGSDLQGMMAVAFVAVVPCILVFFFFQRYFFRGIVTSGFGGR